MHDWVCASFLFSIPALRFDINQRGVALCGVLFSLLNVSSWFWKDPTKNVMLFINSTGGSFGVIVAIYDIAQSVVLSKTRCMKTEIGWHWVLQVGQTTDEVVFKKQYHSQHLVFVYPLVQFWFCRNLGGADHDIDSIWWLVERKGYCYHLDPQ